MSLLSILVAQGHVSTLVFLLLRLPQLPAAWKHSKEPFWSHDHVVAVVEERLQLPRVELLVHGPGVHSVVLPVQPPFLECGYRWI